MSTVNIVSSMEALMAQVKELEARASACEAAKAAAEQRAAELEATNLEFAELKAFYEEVVLAIYQPVKDLYWGGTERGNSGRLIEAMEEAEVVAYGGHGRVWPIRLLDAAKKVEMKKKHRIVARVAAAPPGVAALAAEVAGQKEREAKQDAELMAAVPGDVKRKLAWRFTGAGSTKKGEETWPYYKEERALAAVAVLLKEYGVNAEVEAVAGTSLWHVTVCEEQMERLKAAVMK
jgi:hypothetical protein